MANNFTLNSSDLKLFVNSTLIGIVTSFSFSVDYGRRTITGIDVQVPTEITSGQIKIHGQMNIVRLKNDGGIEGYNLVPKIADISLEKYISIALLDRYSDVVVFKSDFCLIDNQSWDFKSRSLVTGSASFTTIDYINELGSGVALVNSNNNLPSTIG